MVFSIKNQLKGEFYIDTFMQAGVYIRYTNKSKVQRALIVKGWLRRI
jgi:hypothetical protein